MLKVHPLERPTINDIISQLQEVAVARNVNLKAALDIAVQAPSPAATTAPTQDLEEGRGMLPKEIYTYLVITD